MHIRDCPFSFAAERFRLRLFARPLALLLLATLAALSTPASPQPRHAVAPDRAHTERQALRAQLLAEERLSLRDQLAQARMRLAQRLRAGELEPIEDARLSVTNLEQALAALERERESLPAPVSVRAVSLQTTATGPGAPITARPEPGPVRPAAAPAPAAAWWDVYGASPPRRTEAAVPTEPANPRP